MLRALVVVLLLANAVFWAWSEGHLGALGWVPGKPVTEPERLAQQLQPERLRRTAPGEPSPFPSEPTACWQWGGLEPELATTLAERLRADAALANGWALEESTVPARWIVYLGQFPSAEALQRRKAELRQAKVDHRDVSNPALQPGLALGTYTSEAAAQQALRDVARQGLRGASVRQERPEQRTQTLRLAALTEAQKTATDGWATALGAAGLQPCP